MRLAGFDGLDVTVELPKVANIQTGVRVVFGWSTMPSLLRRLLHLVDEIVCLRPRRFDLRSHTDCQPGTGATARERRDG